MKKQLFISLGLLLLFGCQGNIKSKIIKSYLVLDNIQGKVLSLTEYSYRANESYGNLSKGERARRYTFENDFYKKYDIYGRKIEEGKYDDYSDGGLLYKIVYTYDQNGILTEGNYFSTNDEFLRKQTYSYDKTGNLTEKSSTNFDGSFAEKVTYTYDEFGNNVEENIYNKSNQITKLTYQYDSLNHKIEEKYFNINGSLSVSTKYKYDEKGFMIEENKEHFPEIDILSKKITYKYDLHGNKIEEISDGKFGGKWTFKYEYDLHHNWTKQIAFEEEKPLYIIERGILYYE
jgi:hypothetical protein